MSLSAQSTIEEVFAFLDGSDEDTTGAQVVPVTIKQQPEDTQLAIFIKGDHELASVIMGELMSKVTELFDVAQQREAAEDEPSIIT